MSGMKTTIPNILANAHCMENARTREYKSKNHMVESGDTVLNEYIRSHRFFVIHCYYSTDNSNEVLGVQYEAYVHRGMDETARWYSYSTLPSYSQYSGTKTPRHSDAVHS